MRKIKTIPSVSAICPTESVLIIFTQNEIANSPDYIFEILVNNLQSARYSNNEVIYQTKESSNVTLLTKAFEIITYKGDFSIFKAFEYKNGFILINRETKSYHLINSNMDSSEDLGFYFNKSGNINEKYLYKKLGEEIKVFSISKKRVITKINIGEYINENPKPESDIFGLSESIYITLSSGQLIAVDFLSAKLKWKREQVGKIAFYDNRIYCVVAHSLQEIEIKVLDAESGEIIQRKKMPNLDKQYGFRPTGKHKVYEKYIFIMAARKPGLVAILDRETLEFQEMIELEESIPNDVEHLHWFKDRLYVLDSGKNLHIYDDIDSKDVLT